MFPLVSAELAQVDLLRALNRGRIPAHDLKEGHVKALRAYTEDDLKEEVFAELLILNVPAFSRFFDAVGYSHGELTNYANVARDCGVDAKTLVYAPAPQSMVTPLPTRPVGRLGP